MDRVCLYGCEGCSCCTKELLCSGEVLFGFLAPGGYVLTLQRGSVRADLLVRLPPGGNVAICFAFEHNKLSWHNDTFHYFYNTR